MSFNDYWARLQRKNPQMQGDAKMTISVENFRKALEQAYEEGLRSAVQSFMNKLFGGR